MGISLAWVAVEALPVDEALRRLLLARTGEPCEFQHVTVSSHPLPYNWLLVTAMGCDHRVIRPESMAAISAGCRAVACSVEEHVNFASTELWSDGLRTWHVQHEGDRDVENITYAGSPPPRFFELLSTVESGDSENLQGHFHMDIPLLLAKDISGFRHDECNPDVDSTPFERLTDLAPKRPWWRVWR
jgi:hypothetical protein